MCMYHSTRFSLRFIHRFVFHPKKLQCHWGSIDCIQWLHCTKQDYFRYATRTARQKPKIQRLLVISWSYLNRSNVCRVCILKILVYRVLDLIWYCMLCHRLQDQTGLFITRSDIGCLQSVPKQLLVAYRLQERFPKIRVLPKPKHHRRVAPGHQHWCWWLLCRQQEENILS